MITVTGVLLCGCSLMGDWKAELLGESQSRVKLRTGKLLMKWRQGIKGPEASELEKGTDWVGE